MNKSRISEAYNGMKKNGLRLMAGLTWISRSYKKQLELLLSFTWIGSNQ